MGVVLTRAGMGRTRAKVSSLVGLSGMDSECNGRAPESNGNLRRPYQFQSNHTTLCDMSRRALIQHSRPTTSEAENRAIAEVVDSGHHARGPKCRAYEARLAESVGRRAAHATSSGTTALFLALRALGVTTGTSVLIPSLTCAAVMNAVHHCGAEAILYDGDYGLPDPVALRGLRRPDTRCAVVVAPMTGLPSLAAFQQQDDAGNPVAQLDDLPLIFDRCQQLSADQAWPAPALEVFSSYATKCISTGSGGAVAGDNPELFERIRDLNSHDGRDTYPEPRFNYQFDDLRASMGIVQLARLPRFAQRRRAIAERYADELGVRLEQRGMVFRFLLHLPGDGRVDRVAASMLEAGIEAKRPVFMPLHRYTGRQDSEFPLASRVWQEFLSLPIYPTLEAEEMEHVLSYAVAAQA